MIHQQCTVCSSSRQHIDTFFRSFLMGSNCLCQRSVFFKSCAELSIYKLNGNKRKKKKLWFKGLGTMHYAFVHRIFQSYEFEWLRLKNWKNIQLILETSIQICSSYTYVTLCFYAELKNLFLYLHRCATVVSASGIATINSGWIRWDLYLNAICNVIMSMRQEREREKVDNICKK